MNNSIEEIKFTSKKNIISRYIFLQNCFELIQEANILGKGREHESMHYLEYIVYKWKLDNVSIKFYIDDYSEDGWCFDITAESKKECIEYSEKIIDFLMKNFDIQIDRR